MGTCPGPCPDLVPGGSVRGAVPKVPGHNQKHFDHCSSAHILPISLDGTIGTSGCLTKTASLKRVVSCVKASQRAWRAAEAPGTNRAIVSLF